MATSTTRKQQQAREQSDAVKQSIAEYEIDKAARRARLAVADQPPVLTASDVFELAGWMTEAVAVAQAVVADLDDTALSRDLEHVRQAVLRLGQRIAARRKAFQ